LVRVYGPHTFVKWLTFPLRLASPPPFYVLEVPYIDARLPTLFVLAMIAGSTWLVLWAAVRPDPKPALAPAVVGTMETWRLIGVFWLASFVLWTAIHANYRYIVPLDLLSGALIVALLRYLLRPSVLAPAITVVALVLVATTSPPDWRRIDFADRWLTIKLPPVEKHALVLLTSDAPMAYVLPFFPPDARHFGLNNNINNPTRTTLMEASIAKSVREHQGPLYSLSFPVGTGADVLAAHRLSRLPGSCAVLLTNMPTSPIELCRLERR
jgi:hypothetical protein